MEELYEEGRIWAIGVDNLTQERLADFMFWNKKKPMVDFLECNPFYQRNDEQGYLVKNDIQMIAWSPLSAGRNDIFHNETLFRLAGKYGKSVAQIVLRWLVQRNIIPVVKSLHSERMRENLDIYDFYITEEDMQLISELDTGHFSFPERNTGEAVEKFLNDAMK